MKEAITTLQQVRKSYKPIQPSVPIGQDNGVRYQEVYPNDMLQPFIYCYWQLKTNHSLSQPFIYRVVSDGCIDIFFNLLDLSESFVMGFSKKYTEFPIGTTFHYAGIRFLPGAFTLMFGIPAIDLSEKDHLLTRFLPQLATFIASMPVKSFSVVIQQVAQYFSEFLQQKAW